MAERRRGTQGRPMIYGKSPESRRYWNITPEDQKTLLNSKASVNDTATERIRLQNKSAEFQRNLKMKKMQEKESTFIGKQTRKSKRKQRTG